MQLGRAGDRNDPWLLRQKPRKRDLGRRAALFIGYGLEKVDQRLVLLHRLRRETRQDVAEITLAELRILVHRAGEKTLAKWAVGNEADAEFLAGFENAVGLDTAGPERIFVLQHGHRLYCMGAAHRVGAGLRHAEILDLTLGNQVFHRAGDILDRHVGIDAMLIEEIDHLDAETLQAAFYRLPDMRRLAVQAGLLAVDEVEGKLGGDDELIAERLQCLADHFLVGKGAVDLSRVEKRYAAFDRLTDQGDAFLFADLVGITEIQPHAAKAECRHFKAGLSEDALFHILSPFTDNNERVSSGQFSLAITSPWMEM
ncbi:hypothetical protein D3C80_1237620 [compost metagenome]